jgi:hypothetical protein
MNGSEETVRYSERGVFARLCPRFVSDAVTILERIL